MKAGQLVEIERHQQLTTMIGRRLREACGGDVLSDLPTAIADKLAALREAEAIWAAMDGASADDTALGAGSGVLRRIS
jgi:hypothetical protein